MTDRPMRSTITGELVPLTDAEIAEREAEAAALAADPVPLEVTNFQARAFMRGIIRPDGRSLERTVDDMLRAARTAAAALPESDPRRIEADTAWLAWEQSNVFARRGALVTALSAALGYSDAEVDDWFREAARIEA